MSGWHCRRSSLARQTILGDNLLGISVVFFAVVRIRVKEPRQAFFLCVFADYLNYLLYFFLLFAHTLYYF